MEKPKSTQNQLQRKYHLLAISVFVILICLSTLFTKQTSIASVIARFGRTSSDTFAAASSIKECTDIESQDNQCAFVKANCNGFNAVYLELYYCSKYWKIVPIFILLSWLLVLFGAISVAASDFFCPNLQTISAKLQLSESMAGVTILALGNGSNDLFSTFSAMDTGAGSMAIGELIGAAFFIVAVVSGCMGIIRPFQSQRITFTRDASFLTGAVAIMTWIVYYQQICWYHSVVLISYYVLYVCTVVLGAYGNQSDDNSPHNEENKLLEPNESTHLLSQDSSKPPRLTIPDRGFSTSIQSNLSDVSHLGHVIRPLSPNSSHQSIYNSTLPRSASTNGSIMSIATKSYLRPMTPRVGIRTSIFGAIEFQEQVNSIRRSNSSTLMTSPVQRRHRQTSMPPPMWQTLQLPSHDGDNSAKRQRSSTMTGAFNTSTPSIHVVSPTTTYQPTAEDDYFAFISAARHNQPLFHFEPSSPPSSTEVPEIRLAPPPTQPSLLTPSAISDYDLYTSARQSFDRSTSSNSIQKHLTGLPSGMLTPDTQELLCKPVSIMETLFPTLQDWRQKSLFSKLSALAAMPLVLVFTLTLPVAEVEQVKVDDVEVLEDTVNYLSIPSSENDIVKAATGTAVVVAVDDVNTKQGWNKRLLICQCFITTAFTLSVLDVNRYIIFVGLLCGAGLAHLINKSTNAHEPPSWFWMLSFVGFFVALNWIFLLANEVVGLLQALGQIFSISDAILGLTVFAFGNSIGDFVANTAIAKMGFPTMAISACYAGPLLNMVLGVGISSLYQIVKTGESYQLEIAPTIIVSSAGLLTVLASTLIAVSVNGYRVTKHLGIWMIAVYIACSTANLLLEFRVLF